MKRRTIRNPLTGRMQPVMPSRDEVKAELLQKADNIRRWYEGPKRFGPAGETARRNFRHLAYRLREEFGETLDPLT